MLRLSSKRSEVTPLSGWVGRFVASGLTQQEIADKLGVSRRTVASESANLHFEDQPAVTNSRGQERLTCALESVTGRFTGAGTPLSRP